MKTIKNALFGFLNVSADFSRRTGLYKLLPSRANVYDYFFLKFWAGGEIIDIQGSKMCINLKDENPVMRRTFEVYATNRVHELETTNLCNDVLKKGDVFVDLGANIGYFTLLAARLVGEKGRVFSFEPEPKNFGYLSKNIEINNYKNVVAEQKAVSDKNGKTKLFICSYDTGHHTINRSNGIEAYSRGRAIEEKSIEIETITLDNYFLDKVDRVDAIKIDVEGAESLALAGMDRILRQNRDIKIFPEFFPLLIEKMGSAPRDLIDKLMKIYKFDVYAIGSDYAMKNSIDKLFKISDIKTLMSLIKKEDDHVNLYLKKRG
jgi:FkbM family methyltransferase